MTFITPVPATFPLVETDGTQKGCCTTYFKRFLDDLLARIGGITGGIYTKSTSTSAAFVWDLNFNPNTNITLTDPVTIITTVNQTAGAAPYRLTLIQDVVGNRTVSWGSEFKFPSAVVPVLSIAANAVDEIAFDSDGTNMRFQYGNKDLR